jgi:hypothetical protein
MKDAKLFLNSRIGCLPSGESWPKVLDTCCGFHFVYQTPNGTYNCDCKNYWSARECSHVFAAMHLDNAITIEKLLLKIDKPKLPGRPMINVPSGYAAHTPMINAAGEVKAASYIGVPVARYLNGDRTRLYCGKIVGKYCIFMNLKL